MDVVSLFRKPLLSCVFNYSKKSSPSYRTHVGSLGLGLLIWVWGRGWGGSSVPIFLPRRPPPRRSRATTTSEQGKVAPLIFLLFHFLGLTVRVGVVSICSICLKIWVEVGFAR